MPEHAIAADTRRAAIAYATDIVVFDDDLVNVLLIRRAATSKAYAGMLALPGGHVELDEDSRAAARRELREETGIHASGALRLIGVYDDPNRDPRRRVVTAAYWTVVSGLPAPTASGDAAVAQWVPTRTALDVHLAFDHGRILSDARIQASASRSL